MQQQPCSLSCAPSSSSHLNVIGSFLGVFYNHVLQEKNVKHKQQPHDCSWFVYQRIILLKCVEYQHLTNVKFSIQLEVTFQTSCMEEVKEMHTLFHTFFPPFEVSLAISRARITFWEYFKTLLLFLKSYSVWCIRRIGCQVQSHSIFGIC